LALGNIASDYLDLGDMDRAAENFTNATTVAEQLHDRVYEMRWLVGLGETWEESGDLEKAAGSYRKAKRSPIPNATGSGCRMYFTTSPESPSKKAICRQLAISTRTAPSWPVNRKARPRC